MLKRLFGGNSGCNDKASDFFLLSWVPDLCGSKRDMHTVLYMKAVKSVQLACDHGNSFFFALKSKKEKGTGQRSERFLMSRDNNGKIDSASLSIRY